MGSSATTLREDLARALNDYFFNDLEQFRYSAETLLQELPGALLDLERAIEQTNFAAIEYTAHRLAGMVASFSRREFYDRARSIELNFNMLNLQLELAYLRSEGAGLQNEIRNFIIEQSERCA